MILASLNQTDNVYRLLVVLHVLTVIVGFGSTFVYPVTGNYASKHPGLEGKGISNANMLAGQRLTEPAIYASGVLGLVLVVVGPFGFGDPWVSASIALYVAALFFSVLVHQPNLKKMDALVRILQAAHTHLQHQNQRTEAYRRLAGRLLGAVDLAGASGEAPWSPNAFAG